MKVGQTVGLFSHNGFRRNMVISEVGVPSGIGDGLTAYKTEDGALFYMKNELGTNRHYNVANKAFWIAALKAEEVN